MQKKITKYKAFGQIPLQNRKWPDNTISKPPIWCSVDLRDGNQALVDPMNMEQKLTLFKLLVDIGFKEIEVGFPSASAIEYDFLRKLIEENLIPNDVTIQVLCQAREELIKKTFESLKGAKNVTFHIYNSTSIAQRKIVFKKEKNEIIDLILEGIDNVIKYQKDFNGNLSLEYSPESFTNTELDFAKDICNKVVEKYLPHTQNKIILNLPATIEVSTPNIYADMIEWISSNLKHRNKIILSSHTHNDRGTAVAATELALLAGIDRVEGTLLGNGERTGNVDILTLALNMYTQGIYPNLDFKNIDEIVKIIEDCTKIKTHIRAPYVGELVYTAFSGSHQDAIKKGMTYQKGKDNDFWEVPYLPIDPTDLNRTYQDIIRINAQSGKGGSAYILENEFGFILPKQMQSEFATIVQDYGDKIAKEIKKEDILKLFTQYYFDIKEHIIFQNISIKDIDNEKVEVNIQYILNDKEINANAIGNGPIDATKKAIEKNYPHKFSIGTFSGHSLGKTSSAEAVSYIQVESQNHKKVFGIGKDTNTTIATIKAMFCAINLIFKD
jgi:2-isopropylmalate synthase